MFFSQDLKSDGSGLVPIKKWAVLRPLQKKAFPHLDRDALPKWGFESGDEVREIPSHERTNEAQFSKLRLGTHQARQKERDLGKGNQNYKHNEIHGDKPNHTLKDFTEQDRNGANALDYIDIQP